MLFHSYGNMKFVSLLLHKLEVVGTIIIIIITGRCLPVWSWLVHIHPNDDDASSVEISIYSLKGSTLSASSMDF